MADKTNIAWATSTFNPFIGCTKVGPGCDHCYAEALDKRMQYGGATHWGDDKPRYRTSVSNWNNPARWDKKQALVLNAWRYGISLHGGDEAACIANGFIKPEPWRVFCASLADVFDNQVPQQWRNDLWSVILATPNLSWLLVTKRISNVKHMMPTTWLLDGEMPANIRLLITVVDQEEANRDIPKLLAINCKNGISYEPALGPVDWSKFLDRDVWLTRNRIDWIIVGGESTQGAGTARPFNVQWARDTITQCKAAGVPAFVKQIGSQPQGWCPAKLMAGDDGKDFPDDYCDLYEASEINRPCDRCFFLKDRAGADPAEWPEDLRVQEFPA